MENLPPMRMKISVLPNGVRVRTGKPYINERLGQWQAPVTILSPATGARPVVIPLKACDGLTIDAVWQRIHRAAVLGVCEAYKIDPTTVQEITNRTMALFAEPAASLSKQTFSSGRRFDKLAVEPAKRSRWRFWS